MTTWTNEAPGTAPGASSLLGAWLVVPRLDRRPGLGCPTDPPARPSGYARRVRDHDADLPGAGMYEGSPYSDPNLTLPAGGTPGAAHGVLHSAGSLPFTGADVVFYLAIVAALVLVGSALLVLGARLGKQRG